MNWLQGYSGVFHVECRTLLDGQRQGRVDCADVTAKNIKAHSKFNQALAVMNNAFEIVCDACQVIKGVEDSPTKKSMTSELEAAGRTGWGAGISDLME